MDKEKKFILFIANSNLYVLFAFSVMVGLMFPYTVVNIEVCDVVYQGLSSSDYFAATTPNFETIDNISATFIQNILHQTSVTEGYPGLYEGWTFLE